MKLFVTSPAGYSGKTAVSMAMALLLKEDQGFNVGYFKPIGKPGIHEDLHDEDAHLAKTVLGLDYPLEIISPVLLRQTRYLDEIQKKEEFHHKIQNAFEKISTDVEILLIESPCCLYDYISFDLDAAMLAKQFGAQMVLVVTGKDDRAADIILREKYFLEQRAGTDICSGVIFNYIEPYVLERIKGITYPLLEKFNVPVFGIIPAETRVVAPSVSDIYNALGGGEILVGEDKMDDLLVEDFLVGAMSPEASLRWFRRSVRKAVILGGDRPDTALAALTTDTSVLILTGNLHPSTHVLVKADEMGVPVLLVPYDTFTTVRKIEGIVGKARPKPRTIRLMKELIEKHVDWRKILEIIKV
ncbi:MAG: phosphotransacetylase family protein [Promethearchaeota archaeon]